MPDKGKHQLFLHALRAFIFFIQKAKVMKDQPLFCDSRHIQALLRFFKTSLFSVYNSQQASHSTFEFNG